MQEFTERITNIRKDIAVLMPAQSTDDLSLLINLFRDQIIDKIRDKTRPMEHPSFWKICRKKIHDAICTEKYWVTTIVGGIVTLIMGCFTIMSTIPGVTWKAAFIFPLVGGVLCFLAVAGWHGFWSIFEWHNKKKGINEYNLKRAETCNQEVARIDSDSAYFVEKLQHHLGQQASKLKEQLFELEKKFKEEVSAPWIKAPSAIIDLKAKREELLLKTEEEIPGKKELLSWFDEEITGFEDILKTENPENGYYGQLFREAANEISSIYENVSSLTLLKNKLSSKRQYEEFLEKYRNERQHIQASRRIEMELIAQNLLGLIENARMLNSTVEKIALPQPTKVRLQLSNS